jgi:transcriptional regulator with PAS, ATPase and Fis domain
MPSPRTTAAELSRLLNRIAAPVYVLDEDRRLIFANEVCIAWVGRSLDDLIGRTASFASAAGNESMAIDLLCPPPEAFAGRRMTGAVFVDANGVLRRRRAEFVPLEEVQAPSTTAVLVLCASTDEDAAPDTSSEIVTPAREDDAELLHTRLAQFHAEQHHRYRLESIIGESPAMQLARSQVKAAITSRASATIVGPPGSGPPRLARIIHYNSQTPGGDPSKNPRGATILVLDGSLLTPDVLQTAVAAHAAHARDAPTSVLLSSLDQISVSLQEEIWRLLLHRFPGIRLLATSEVPPDELLSQGRLHPQVAAVAGVLIIRLTPLAQRRQDIPLLVQALVEENNTTGGKQLRGVTPAAMDELVAYAWPGDVDEVREFVAQACARAEGFEITPGDLPRRLALAAGATRRPPRPKETIQLEPFLSEIERELIERALKEAGGNKTRAALLLGLTRPRLYRRMVQLGMEPAPTSEPRPDAPVVAPASRKRRPRGNTELAPIDSVSIAATSSGEAPPEAEYIEDIPFEEQPE